MTWRLEIFKCILDSCIRMEQVYYVCTYICHFSHPSGLHIFLITPTVVNTVHTSITFPPTNGIIMTEASPHKPYKSDGVKKPGGTDMTIHAWITAEHTASGIFTVGIKGTLQMCR